MERKKRENGGKTRERHKPEKNVRMRREIKEGKELVERKGKEEER